MATVDQITSIVNEKISGSPIYLVEVHITPSNKITVLLDRDDKLALSDCVEVSRFIESKLNRDVEDFELEVSSPGLDRPLKILRQYQRHSGKQVRIVCKDGKIVTGKMLEANEQGVKVEQKTRERIEGKKGRQEVVTILDLPFSDIKETKLVISFN